MRRTLIALFAISIGIAAGQNAACENGGFPINNTTCNCPSFWAGDLCEKRLCINGGYTTIDNRTYCVCPPGYKGVACEAVLAAPSPSSTFKLQSTSFNLIIFNLFTDYWGMQSIHKIIGSINTTLGGLTKDFQEYNYFENYLDSDDYYLLANQNDTPFHTNNDIPAIKNNQGLIDYLESFVPKKTRQYSCFTLDGFYQQISRMIRDKKLQRTTITVVTQNPPSPSTDGEYEELVFLANAHQVKINIVMIEDPVFMRCDHAGGDTRSIWNLPRQTNGHTAVIKYDDSSYDTSLITNLFTLQSGYELMTQHFAESCKDQQFLMDFDQETSKNQSILLVVHASRVDGLGWNQMNQSYQSILTRIGLDWEFSKSPSFSTFKDLWVFELSTIINPGQKNLTVNVTTNYDVPCSLKAYRKKADSSIEALSSFVVQTNLDTAQTAPESGNDTHLTLHLETALNLAGASVKITPMNSKNSTSDPIDLTHRPTTFEWISSKPFTCGDATWSSVKVQIQTNTTDNQTYYRTIPHLCYNYLKPTTPPQPKVLAVQDLANCKGNIFRLNSTTCFVDPSKRNNTKDNIFVFGLSNTETNAFVLDPELLLPSLNGFSRIKLIMWDKLTVVDDAEVTTASAAQTLLYSTFKLDPNELIDAEDTQLFKKLTTLADDLKEEENGLIWLLLGDRLPPSNAFDDFKQTIAHRIFVNQGHRVFAFMDSNLTRNDLRTWDVNAINSLVGTTNGHFITIDKSDYNYNNSAFSNISTLIYQNLVNGRLLLAANSQDFTKTTFPTLKLETDQTNVIVTATPIMTKNSNVLCTEPPIIIVGNGQPAIKLQQQGNSNFYWAQGNLPANTYRMSLAGFCFDLVTSAPVGMHIRFWTEPQAASVQHANLTMGIPNDFSLPNNEQGFAARLAIPVKSDPVTSTKATVSILQCDGTPTKLYGQTQEAISLDVSEGNNGCTNSYFYPYFCQSQSPIGCPADFDGIHYAQFTINASGNTTQHFTRPFICLDSGNTPDPNCQATDRFGNNVCGGTTAPYSRGPTGKVVDCSNNGENYYKPTSSPLAYECCCSNEFTGDSCQNGKCLEPNTRGGAIDTAYRTFSVVFGYGKNSVPVFVDRTKILPSDPIDGVWLYQAFTEFVGNGVVPIYIGPNFDDFINAINNMTFESMDTNDTFILQNTLKQVTASFGSSPSRGLTVIHYYVDPGSYDSEDQVNAQVSATVNDSDPSQLESLYKQLQLMNQQVVVFTNFDSDGQTGDSVKTYGQNDALGQAALSTGGMSFMVTVDPEDEDFNTFKSDLLSDWFFNNGPAFTVNQKRMAGGQTFTFSTGDEPSVLVWSETQTHLLALFNSSCSGNKIDLPNNTKPLDKGTYCLSANANGAVVSIFAKDNGYGLATGFVQKWSDDQTNAVATVTTAIGPSLMGYTNPDYAFVNADSSTRESKRTSCTYQEVSYSLQKIDKPGYNTILLNILKDGSTVATRMVPFAATASIDCMNGGTFDGGVGSCQCPKDWAGVDCSIPQCFGGVNGTWGTTCNCVGFASNCDQPWKSLQLTTLY